MLSPRRAFATAFGLLLVAGCVEEPPVPVDYGAQGGGVPPAQQVYRLAPGASQSELPPAQRVYRPSPATPTPLARPPVTVTEVQVLPKPKPSPAASPAASRPDGGLLARTTVVKARPGDTVYDIAKRNGVPLRTLLELNRLSPPYVLVTGQPLALPRTKVHVVHHNDTLYSISRRYDVDLFSLAQVNGIKPPYRILVGQRLKLPYADILATPLEQNQAIASGSKPSVMVLRSPDSVAVEEPAPATGRPELAPIEVPKPSPGSGPRPEASGGAEAATAEPAAPQGPADKSAAIPAPPPRAGKSFAWPARGRILSAFGPKLGGLHNDGINIALPRGAPVRAAENGVVVYAGNELRGYGNLLLIRHASGYMTAYAHNEKLLVSRGDLVRKGQIIARAGSTGSVTSPQLHFEIRRGAQAVNPLQYLSSSAAGLEQGGTSPPAGPGGRPGPG